jgi:hypothetical protein
MRVKVEFILKLTLDLQEHIDPFQSVHDSRLNKRNEVPQAILILTFMLYFIS